LVNGALVVDQESLIVEREVIQPELQDMEVVQETSNRYLTSSTFGKKTISSKWTEEENKAFYQVKIKVFLFFFF